MFRNGEGVAQDYAEAVRLYSLAAAQGHADSQVNLGTLFESGEGILLLDNGQGVGQDRAEATRWYRLAAAQGDARVKNFATAALKRLGV